MVDLKKLAYTELDAAVSIAKRKGDTSHLLKIFEERPEEVIAHDSAMLFISGLIRNYTPPRQRGRPTLKDQDLTMNHYIVSIAWYYIGCGYAEISKSHTGTTTVCSLLAAEYGKSQEHYHSLIANSKDDDKLPHYWLHLASLALGLLEAYPRELGPLTHIGPPTNFGLCFPTSPYFDHAEIRLSVRHKSVAERLTNKHQEILKASNQFSWLHRQIITEILASRGKIPISDAIPEV